MTGGTRVASLLTFVAAALAVAAGWARAAELPDSLGIDEVLARESAKLDSLLRPESRSDSLPDIEARIRAIDEGGRASLDSLGHRPKSFHTSFSPGEGSTYNRVEGVRLSLGAGLRYGSNLRLNAAGGYAISAHRWVGSATFLVGRRNWGPALALSAQDQIEPFGPNRIEALAGLQSWVAGQDRQEYLRRREVRLTIAPVRTPEVTARLAGWIREDLSSPARTDAHLFGGGTPMERPNPDISEGDLHGVTANAIWNWRGDLVHLDAIADLAGGGLGGDYEYAAQSARVRVRPVLPGGTLMLDVEGRNTAGSPPVQESALLGGDGNLRGYAPLEFNGRRRLVGRIEYELGIDLFRRAHIPLLEKASLQLIPFADLGTTWGEATTSPVIGRSSEGTLRSSFGLGIRKDLWLPGVRAVRVDLIDRSDGADDRFHVWFRILPFNDL